MPTKKLKLIYNPHSGDGNFKSWLHECVAVFQAAGYETHVFLTMRPGDVAAHIAAMPRGYAAVAVAGGDGTLNIAASALFAEGYDAPLLIIPSGTANDFASFLKIPRGPEEAAGLINGAPVPVDVGFAGGRLFLNVCAAGLLANVSQAVDAALKDSFGKAAYYMTGLSRLAGLTPLRFRFTRPGESFEEDIYQFLALNTSGIGGLSNLAPEADAQDGLFDFIIVRAAPLMDVARLGLRLLSGEHLSDPAVIYFRDSRLTVEPLFDDEQYMFTDADGEPGPKLPFTIENQRGALRVFLP